MRSGETSHSSVACESTNGSHLWRNRLTWCASRCEPSLPKKIIIVGVAVLSSTFFARSQAPVRSPASPGRSDGRPVAQEQIVRDPGAVKLLTSVWQSMGGPSWNAAPQIQLSGTMNLCYGVTQRGQFDILVTHAGDTDVVITDGNGGNTEWKTQHGVLTASIPGKTPKPLLSHKALNSPPYVLLDLINRAVEDPSWSVTLGQSQSGTVIEVVIRHVFPLRNDPSQQMSQFTERHLYVDRTSGTPVRIRYTDYADNNIRIKAPREVDFSDYRWFGPYFLPATMSESLMGHKFNQFMLAAIR